MKKTIIERINFGDDVAFKCGGRHFVVCPTAKGCDIAERGTCRYRAVFPDGQTLVNEYRVDGKTIAERIDKIEPEEC